MSAYMVQENHQRKLNTLLFQYVIPLYFSWIILDHPVVGSALTLKLNGIQTHFDSL